MENFPSDDSQLCRIDCDTLRQIFDTAETETAAEFEGRTCSMLNRYGEETCPICYFRQRVKEHLRLLAPPDYSRPVPGRE